MQVCGGYGRVSLRGREVCMQRVRKEWDYRGNDRDRTGGSGRGIHGRTASGRGREDGISRHVGGWAVFQLVGQKEMVTNSKRCSGGHE